MHNFEAEAPYPSIPIDFKPGRVTFVCTSAPALSPFGCSLCKSRGPRLLQICLVYWACPKKGKGKRAETGPETTDYRPPKWLPDN